MKSHWIVCNQEWFGFPCIQHIYTNDLALVGRRGVLFKYSNNSYALVLNPSRIVSLALKKRKLDILSLIKKQFLIKDLNFKEASEFISLLDPYRTVKHSLKVAVLYESLNLLQASIAKT